MLYIAFFYLAIGVALVTFAGAPVRVDGKPMGRVEEAIITIAFVPLWLPILAAIAFGDYER